MAARQPDDDEQPDPPGVSPRASATTNGPPSWGTASEAVSVCLHRPNRRRIALITAVVGTLLVAINQGSVLTSGKIGWVTLVRIGLDYVTPACVSTLGVLAGSRRGDPRA